MASILNLIKCEKIYWNILCKDSLLNIWKYLMTVESTFHISVQLGSPIFHGLISRAAGIVFVYWLGWSNRSVSYGL